VLYVGVSITLGISKKCPPIHYEFARGALFGEFLCLPFTSLFEIAPNSIKDALRPKRLIILPSAPSVVEDAGKEAAYNQPEVQSLIALYGADHVLVKALDRHLILRKEHWHSLETESDRLWREEHDALLGMIVKPGLAIGDVGCVIVVYAMGEGFVYWEDHDLNIIASETLAEFQYRTTNVSPDVMFTFYLSLR
jgi:hypothetical protein